MFVLQMHHLAEAGACAGSRQLPVSGIRSERGAGSKIRFLQTGIRANPGFWIPDMMFTGKNEKTVFEGCNQNQDTNQEVHVNPVIEHVVHVGPSRTSPHSDLRPELYSSLHAARGFPAERNKIKGTHGNYWKLDFYGSSSNIIKSLGCTRRRRREFEKEKAACVNEYVSSKTPLGERTRRVC